MIKAYLADCYKGFQFTKSFHFQKELEEYAKINNLEIERTEGQEAKQVKCVNSLGSLGCLSLGTLYDVLDIGLDESEKVYSVQIIDDTDQKWVYHINHFEIVE